MSMRPVLPPLLCLVLAACSGAGHEPKRVFSQPPLPAYIEQAVLAVAQAAKWAGPSEVSPLRQAHLLAPADWVVCARSGARDLSPPYAIFFSGNVVQHFRLAVELDECMREPYVMVVPTGAPPAAVVVVPQPDRSRTVPNFPGSDVLQPPNVRR
jgi:hypothetical protein